MRDIFNVSKSKICFKNLIKHIFMYCIIKMHSFYTVKSQIMFSEFCLERCIINLLQKCPMTMVGKLFFLPCTTWAKNKTRWANSKLKCKFKTGNAKY